MEILEELGRGAWTVVYRARRDSADYALRVLDAPVVNDEQALLAFRREAAMLASVTHPGVARVHEVGSTHGRPYLVIDLVEGQTLESLLADGRLDESRAVEIVMQVAAALAAAHRVGLVHRDVKPDNIVITPDGRAKVIDFGLARWVADAGDDAVAGTVAYMAPEQTGMLKRLVDGRSDLYSLGVVLFRCTTGRLPFVSSDAGELMRLHTVAPPPDVLALRPQLSPGLAAVVAKLLAKDPDDRYQNGDGLVADLARLKAEGGQRLHPLGSSDAPIGEIDAPLVGRDAELTQLSARWAKARSGHGGLAMVCGEAGSGKSRLLRELAALARGEGALVLRGACAPDDAMPMAPLRSAVEQHLRGASELPEPHRSMAVDRVRAAAAPVAPMVRALSPALAGLLDTRKVPEQARIRPEQFAAAVAAFLAQLARESGGALLHLDDVQWLDPGSRRVLRHLADDVGGTPLLVAVTARDDGESWAATEAFATAFDRVVDTRLDLGALDDQAVGQLLAAYLGADVPGELTRQLVTRCGGNPFTIGEYLWAAIDAGLIRPYWGTWVLDVGGLDGLELPADVLRLIVSRVDGFGGDSRRLLAAAAAFGSAFRPDRLARVCAVDERHVLDVVRVATDSRLIVEGDAGEVDFVHDRIREALLAEVDAVELRSLHQRIADVLEATPSPGSEHVYSVARHYSRGEVVRTPERVFKSCSAAGALALSENAPQEALEFLELADAAAVSADIDEDSRFSAAFGLACLRTGRFAEASDRLRLALTSEPDPHRRATLHALTSEIHLTRLEADEMIGEARQGLAELGRWLPSNPVLLLIATVWFFARGLLVQWLRVGRGTATGAERERYELEVALTGVAAIAAVRSRRRFLMSCFDLRLVYPANRLGLSLPYVRALSLLAGGLRCVGMVRWGDRLFERMYHASARLNDPRATASVAWFDGLVRFVLYDDRHETREILRRVLVEHGRWLDAPEYVLATTGLSQYLLARGYPQESLTWHERARDRIRDEQAHEGVYLLSAAASSAMLGRGKETTAQMGAAHASVVEQPDNREAWTLYLWVAAMTAVEQGQLGAEFDSVVADVRRLRLSPRRLWPMRRVLWVYLAHGRLAQCLVASDEQRPDRLAVARTAIGELRRAASTPFIRTDYLIAQAAYRQLAGDDRRALRILGKADRHVQGLDAPILEYEIARVRARAFRSLGLAPEARRQAHAAFQLAIEHGWEPRCQWVRAEFGVGESSHRRSASPPGEAGRRLDALQQVSTAAATVLDPRELTRVALDETVRILGADRAFLFLVDNELSELVPQLGRDASGGDLDTLTGYATSLVARVAASGEPLVVTSDAAGWALRSRSAEAYGLHSIMVAPIWLKDRLCGVVYLDSRMAKGVFTGDDVEILSAIMNHIAVSLTTAHAAQLEADFQAAQRQRDLAEKLRSEMSTLSRTLDPDEVLRRLLDAATRMVQVPAGCVLWGDEKALSVAAVSGSIDRSVVGQQIDPGADGMVDTMLKDGLPIRGSTATDPAPVQQLLPGARSWLAVPCIGRDGKRLLLLFASPREHTYTEADVDVAAALAGHAMIAYDNARRFSSARELAAIDGLTGIYNRRQFLELADLQFAAAAPEQPAQAVIMIDVDHFKKINDSHGHPVGDEVLREIGKRLRSTVRESDLAGRVGGEEFAVFLAADADASKLAERIRVAVAATPMQTSGGPIWTTVSIGSTYRRDGDSDVGAILVRADAALYEAKRRGRDRTVHR